MGARRRGARVVVLAALLLGLTTCGDAGSAASGPDHITVAAASDLRFAFEELGARFRADTGIDVVFSFGSSGQLREQVLNGAPFDVYASADAAFVDAVIDAGQGDQATRADYGFGRLALWSPAGVELPGTIADLADPRFERIAIANPQHAPYGAAAEQALDAAGILGAVRERLVFGESVSDALRIGRSRNADVAVVALSLVIAQDAPYVLVDEELHEPLQQALVVTAPPEREGAARAFTTFLTGPAGRELMVRYGFALPGEAPPD